MKRITSHNICRAFFLLPLLVFIAGPEQLIAQPEPGNALWRSLIVPGWGHYYVDSDDWSRGQFHLAADAILIAGWVGLDARSRRLKNQSMTLANLRAGIDLADKDRAFRLVIGNFENLQEYNEHQLRTRNWDRLIDDIPENRWSWTTSDHRRTYRELRSDSDRIRQQIPAVISLMVVNRVISGLSAYLRARDLENLPALRLDPVEPGSVRGYKATLRFGF